MVVQGCDVVIAHRPTDQIWLIHRVDEQHDLPEGRRNMDWGKAIDYVCYRCRNGIVYPTRINGLVMM